MLVRLARPLLGTASRRVKKFPPSRWYTSQNPQLVDPRDVGTDEVGLEGVTTEKMARRMHHEIGTILSMPNLRHVVVTANDVRCWVDLLAVEDFKATVERLKVIDNVPTWVLLYILTTKIHSPDDAQLALAFTFERLPTIHEADRPALLIQNVRILARYRVSLFVSRILDEFLQMPLKNEEVQFDLLLRNLGRFNRSSEVSKEIIKVLVAMQARGVKMRTHSYNALLANRYLTLELTKYLRSRMSVDGHTPSAEQLEAYLRIFGTRGHVFASSHYLGLVRRLRRSSGGTIPTGLRLLGYGNKPNFHWSFSSGKPTRHNTEFMRSLLHYPGSAFGYLYGLLRGPDGTVHKSGVQEKRSPRAPNPRCVGAWKSQVDEYDWTTALNAAARDHKMNEVDFLNLFDKIKATHVKPTIATYTTVVRGVVRKSTNYVNALKLWREMASSVNRLDKVALTVGMDILVGSGQALEAFRYIEESTSPSARVARKPIHRRRYFKAGTKPQVDTRLVDTILVNAFMSALVKHGRPDAVFLLWNGMGSAFGLQPDVESLAEVLKAARKAGRLDRSFQAMFVQLKTMLPGRKEGASVGSEEISRDELVTKIQDTLAVVRNPTAIPGDEASFAWKVAISSLWDGVPAGAKALSLFRDVIFNNWPHLRNVQAPAYANWSDEATSASVVGNIMKVYGFGRRLEKLVERQEKDAFAQDTLQSSREVPRTVENPHARNHPQAPNDEPQENTNPALPHTSPYAFLIPTEKCFAAYIALLGSQNRSSEIPVTLAWMRELDVKPTKPTLALALALWAEVSLRGPLVERYAPEETREYEKILWWVGEWVGKEGMVSEAKVVLVYKELMEERVSK